MSMRTDDVYAILSKRIDMQGATPSQIQEAVNKYLSENPVDSVTEENIKAALGYTPADQEEVAELNEKLVQLEDEVNAKGESLSLYEQAKQNITRFKHQYMKRIERNANVVDIILFSGQSNSCGRATLADCSTDEDLILDIPVSKGFSFNNTESTEPLQIVEPITANGSSGYGYIPTFINSYYETTKRKVCACYKSSGGTMLNKFLPYVLDDITGEPTTTQGKIYSEMIRAINHAKTNIVSNGYEVGEVLLVWCQGESDGDYLGTVNDYAISYEQSLTEDSQKIRYYKEKFLSLVDALKTDVGLSTAFIIRIGHKKTDDTSYTPIIEAQNQLGKENDDCVLVSTIFAGAKKFIKEDGSVRNLMRDSWHYLPEGYVRAGLEGGINAGIYINSDKKVKPILLEYRTLVNDDNTLYERKIDKFIYDPCRIDLNFIKKLVNNIEPNPLYLDMDFTKNTIQHYIDNGVITTGDSTISELTYNEDGLVCNDTDLRYGLKLTNPIDVSGSWYVELTAKIKSYEEMGTTEESLVHANFAILSGVDKETNNHVCGNKCLSPCILCTNTSILMRLITSETTSININSVFLRDGLEHFYRFEKDNDGMVRVYRDNMEIRKTSFEGASGYFGHVLGAHKGYPYSNQYALEAGITIKRIKVGLITA